MHHLSSADPLTTSAAMGSPVAMAAQELSEPPYLRRKQVAWP